MLIDLGRTKPLDSCSNKTSIKMGVSCSRTTEITTTYFMTSTQVYT